MRMGRRKVEMKEEINRAGYRGESHRESEGDL